MPWTEITRAQYQREGLRFASDMTDAEWALIARRLPARRRLGRPRMTDLRRVVEAILYVLATGCQWRALPGDFPPRSTVQGYFYTWRDTGLWQQSSPPWCGGRGAIWGAIRADGGHHRQPEYADHRSRRAVRV